MVILTGKISKGTLMDQVYLPKERPMGFELGAPVVIKPLVEEEEIKFVYYNIDRLESVKVIIMQKIFSELNFTDNIIITGSFLEKGFQFNDIDVILIGDKKIDAKKIEQHLKKLFDLKLHLIALDYSALLKGLETDPLYQNMLSKCVAKKKLIFRYENKINYKLLDLHLLKSKPLIENFDYLTGKQKYHMARNLITIFLFLNNIKRLLKEDSVNLKQNIIINKNLFLKKYRSLYNNILKRILEGIKNGS